MYLNPRNQAHTAFLLYQKVLTRSLFYTPPKDTKTKEMAAHTKADILNLISTDASAVAKIGWKFIAIFRSQLEMLLGCTYVWFLLGKSLTDVC
jgi:hypothetical protein